MTKDISQRKREHLQLAQDENLRFNISAGFEKWRLVHNALPEFDLEAVDTSTKFLNKELSFPLLISSMSGGHEESHKFNATLGEAAQEIGCALGLGSIRAALEDPKHKESFFIARKMAPDSVILANLGIAQLIAGKSMLKTINFCEEMEADGLIIHLNSMQEAFQPGGDTHFSGGINAIQTWVENFPLPLIVKEVGQGLSPKAIQMLQDVGIQYVDIAGAGGSNWITIERERLQEDQTVLRETARQFENWGEPTADVLAELETDIFVIASGGLKQPLDLTKSLALGANMGGIAGAVLKPAVEGDLENTVKQLMVWKETLRMSMFGMGVKNISDLVGNRTILKETI